MKNSIGFGLENKKIILGVTRPLFFEKIVLKIARELHRKTVCRPNNNNTEIDKISSKNHDIL